MSDPDEPPAKRARQLASVEDAGDGEYSSEDGDSDGAAEECELALAMTAQYIVNDEMCVRLDLQPDELVEVAGLLLLPGGCGISSLKVFQGSVIDLTADSEEALCVALENNESLTALNLGGARCKAEQAERMWRAIAEHPGLTSLTLGRSWERTVDLAGVTSVLRENPQITSLSIRDTSCYDPAAAVAFWEAVGASTSLETLEVPLWRGSQYRTPLPSAAAAAAAVAANNSLKRLWLGNVAHLTDELMDALARSPSLTELAVSPDSPDCGALAPLVSRSASLTTLVFTPSTGRLERLWVLLQAVRDSGTLRRLTLLPWLQNDAVAEVRDMLRGNSSLEFLQAILPYPQESFGPIAAAVRVHTSLRALRLDCAGLQDGGAAELAAAVRESGTLEELGLSSCLVTPTGLAEVLAAVRDSATMTELDMGHSFELLKGGGEAGGKRQTSKELGDAEWLAFADLVRGSGTLRKLRIGASSKGTVTDPAEEGPRAFLDAVAGSVSLRSLDLCERFSPSGLGQPHGAALADMLRRNGWLRELHGVHILWDPAVAKAVGKALLDGGAPLQVWTGRAPLMRDSLVAFACRENAISAAAAAELRQWFLAESGVAGRWLPRELTLVVAGYISD